MTENFAPLDPADLPGRWREPPKEPPKRPRGRPRKVPPVPPPPEVPSDPPPAPDLGPTPVELHRARAAAAELLRRGMESLSLYEPLPQAQQFHASMVRRRLAIGSNRSSKTMTAAVEITRAICSCDPYHKWPLKDGRLLCVGEDEDHIGNVMWDKLFCPGAFDIIRDERTQKWRVWKWWQPYDDAYQEKRQPAPPLLPARMIRSVAWKDKKRNVPTLVNLKTGWRITWLSGKADPEQGSKYDGAWFDEEIYRPNHYTETAARLVDKGGRFMWSATPLAATEILYALNERAESGDGSVERFLFLLRDNPYITPDRKLEFAQELELAGEAERAARLDGVFVIGSYRIFPEFDIRTHGIHPQDLGDKGEIPADWCRYVVVDPGTQVCAVLFAVLPPDNRYLYLHDELYLKRCDAVMFAENLAQKLGSVVPEAFIIDHHMGRHTEIGSGLSVEQQYTNELAKRKVESRRTKSAFIWGSDDIKGGLEAVRALLRIRPDGTPKLRVVRGRLPNFEHEIARYHYKRDASQVLTDEPMNRVDHLMSCVRYLAAFEPHWVRPPLSGTPTNPILAYLEKRRLRRQQQGQGNYIHLGPGSAPG